MANTYDEYVDFITLDGLRSKEIVKFDSRTGKPWLDHIDRAFLQDIRMFNASEMTIPESTKFRRYVSQKTSDGRWCYKEKE